MKQTSRRTPLVFIPTFLVCLLPRTSLPAPASAPVPPKLAVVVSVDGLSWNTLRRFEPWWTGGLKRLLDEGRVETACRYRHLNTATGPGHSSLSTGAPPRVTGIVGNSWYEQDPDGFVRRVGCVHNWTREDLPGLSPSFYREVPRLGRLYVFTSRRRLERWQRTGELIYFVERLGWGPDETDVVFDSEKAVTLFRSRRAGGDTPRGYVTGPGNLRVPTLGDRLVAQWPQARVVSLSGKDRSAILLAGRNPRHAVFWYDSMQGRFKTTTAYDAASPAGQAVGEVVGNFNVAVGGTMLPGRLGLQWSPLPTPEPSVQTLPRPEPNLTDYQLTAQGLGWDHDLSRDSLGYFHGLYISPFIDQLVGELALRLIEDPGLALGRRQVPDLLAVSFSAQDIVSHSYGPDSEENLDTLRRLDLLLGNFLERLEHLFPDGGVVLALSADHGMAPIPEVQRRHGVERGGRVVTSGRGGPSFLQRLNRLLREELCLGPKVQPVRGLAGWGAIYDRQAFPQRTVAGSCGPAGRLVTLAQLDDVFPRVTLKHFGDEFERVLRISQKESWPDDPVVAIVRNAFDPERSGDVFLIPRRNVIMHWDPARGTNHGTHYDYDTHVPLIFWGGPFQAGRGSQDTTPYDLAPTLAALLGVDLPDAVGQSRLPR